MTNLLGPKFPGEIIPLAHDFSAMLPQDGSVTISSGSLTITVQIGDPDPDIANMLFGPVFVSNNTVQQQCRGGVIGNHYRVKFHAICSNGAEIEDVRFLEVTDRVPQ